MAAIPGESNIKYCAVGRMTDKIILASCTNGKNDPYENEYMNSVREVLRVAKQQVQPKSRHKLSFDLGTLHFLADTNDCIYVVITVASYPERHAFAMVEELITKFGQMHGGQLLNAPEGSLNKTSKKMMKELCVRFDDLRKIDKVHGVIDRVENVKEIMQNNVKKILETHENLEVLEDKTDNLRVSANQFQRSAVDLKRMMYWRNFKLKLVIGLVILAVACYILVPIIVKMSN
eukprot:GILK01000842.1.p1 GENE.GILK01000842.1~~GILK01000842.1.p1  ORF type:complete len:261 (+),score=44.17 GILK01000842.1:85-783(+)